MDLLPTFAQLCGYSIPASRKIDGINVFPFLTTGAGKEPVARTFFYNHGGVAVREGDWKWVRGRKGGLYDLEEDIGERKDLREEFPEKAAQLDQLIDGFLTDMREHVRKPGKPPISPSEEGTEKENEAVE